MITQGEQNEFAEAIAARAAKPSHLTILRVELQRITMGYAGRIYVFLAAVAGTLPLIVVFELMLNFNNVSLAMHWFRLAGYATIALAAVLAWVFELRYMRRLRRELPGRLRSAGMIERIAMGPGELPDIYQYAPWPWSMLLGPKPVTYIEHVRLIAANLDWYLLPEPRRFFRITWLFKMLFIVAFPVAIISQVISIVNSAVKTNVPAATIPSTAPTGIPTTVVLLSILVAGYSLAFIYGHGIQRLVHCTEALYFEVKQRLRENEPPGAAVE